MTDTVDFTMDEQTTFTITIYTKNEDDTPKDISGTTITGVTL